MVKFCLNTGAPSIGELIATDASSMLRAEKLDAQAGAYPGMAMYGGYIDDTAGVFTGKLQQLILLASGLPAPS